MIEPRADRPRPITLGADKAYDAEDLVNELRSMTATPHVRIRPQSEAGYFFNSLLEGVSELPMRVVLTRSPSRRRMTGICELR
jgi:hypothetical protein